MPSSQHALTIQDALALHQTQQWDAARAAYAALIAQAPDNFDALHLLGVLEHQQKHTQRAIELMRRAAELNPSHADVYFNLGVAQAYAKNYPAAIDSYSQAIANRPDHDKAWSNRGMAWLALGNHQAALDSLEGALRIQPQSASTHTNCGVVLKALGRWDEALQSFAHALALSPQHADAYLNQGNTLQAMGQFAQAVACYDQAIALNPHLIEAYSNRGVALKEQLKLTEALDSYDRALMLNPTHVEAHWNKALDLLLLGNFAQGWSLHEWRWQRPQAAAFQRQFTQPLWLGDTPLAGKTIVLHAEQGFGDTLQFCRYVHDVAKLGAQVVLEVPTALMGLMRSLSGVATLVARGNSLPPFDCHCPLMSLPLALQCHRVDVRAPYLQPSAAHQARWAERLRHVKRPRVGLVWSGNPSHNNDLQRSVSLEALLACVPEHMQAVSLQQEVRAHDQAVMQAHPQLLHFGADLQDFEDTAALCQQMDWVISVDTSVAHLSCAIGHPTGVLLPYCPDWRWQLMRQDSPWYPSAKLYRQHQHGDWSEVWQTLKKDLHQHNTV